MGDLLEKSYIGKEIFPDTLLVYHGSTSIIDRIDVTRGKPYKDFGRGFYVTKSMVHARNIALRNQRIEKEIYGVTTGAYLYTYEMDQTELAKYNMKEFSYADIEWLNFVLQNRKARNHSHQFDIVIGPTANDDTMVVINAYLDGLYGEIGADNALNTLLKNIEAENLPGQICFTCDTATGMLIPKGQVERL